MSFSNTISKLNSIKLKILLFLLLPFIPIAVFVYFFITIKSDAEINSEAQNLIIATEKVVKSETLRILNSPDSLEINVESFLSSSYVIEYYILMKDSAIISSFNLNLADQNNFLLSPKFAEMNYNNVIVKRSFSLISSDDKLFDIHYGVVFPNLSEQSIQKQKDAFLLSSAIILVGFGFSILLVSITVSPLQKFTHALSKIKFGKLEERIPINNKDEIGEIASGVNNLLDNLQDANMQINNLNKEVKVVFRDKLAEMGLEINRRKLIEESLRKSEEQFRLLIQFAPVGMVVTSPKFLINKVNPAFCEMTGYTESELIDRMYVYELSEEKEWKMEQLLSFKLMGLKKEEIMEWPEEDKDNWYETEIKKKSELQEKFSDFTIEKKFHQKKGKVIYTISKTILLRDEKGNPFQFVSQVIDISDRKKFEKEIVAAKEKAEESDRLKSAFLSQMSHEIRTPLNVILNATPLIADELQDKTDAEMMTIVDSVGHAGKRLQRTIDLILNMSSVQSGSYTPKFTKVDTEKEIKILMKEFRKELAEKNLNINFNCKTSDPVIDVDEYTFDQIFQNLLDNSIKYTLRGEVEVIIDRNAENNLFISVKDSGIGMSDDFIKQLFTPFLQEDVGQKREFEGNGLGLALVKKYVELNNAYIEVKSVKNSGSTFTVTFNQNPPVN